VADFKDRFAEFSAGFSGFETTIDGVLAEGDIVAVRWTTTGTNEGPLFGMEPTGQTVSWTGLNVYRFECGRIAESWSENDLFSLLQQLGVSGVPATPTG
jgi:predicted ester cyclase